MHFAESCPGNFKSLLTYLTTYHSKILSDNIDCIGGGFDVLLFIPDGDHIPLTNIHNDTFPTTHSATPMYEYTPTQKRTNLRFINLALIMPCPFCA